MTWMRLPKEYTGPDSKFVILPIPYEDNPTYGEGASKGPEAIITASEQLEYYDEQFDCEPFVKGIQVLKNPIPPNSQKPEASIEAISEAVKGLGDKGDKFLLGLGGDHAVTIGIVKGLEEKHKDFSVLILDAHSDFRSSWNGSPINHACVSRNLVKNHKVGIIGVRSQDADEAKEAQENDNVIILKAHAYDEKALDKVLEFLGDKVYLSIDVDVFDPSFIRNTGTPEPGGFTWDRVISILEQVFTAKTVIAADIVEFAPKENYRAEAYALAKLAYKLFALKE